MEQIFHGQFSLHDAAIFGCKYIIPLGAKRIGGKVALSGNFNILRAKKVLYKNLCKACHKLFKWIKQYLMITNSISTSCSINIF